MARFEQELETLKAQVQFYKEAASDRAVLEHRIEAQRADIEQLHKEYDELKQSERHYEKHGVPGEDVVLDQHVAMSKKAAQKEAVVAQGFHFGASVTLRYAYASFGDAPDLRQTKDEIWWATRLRFYATYDDPEAIVTGGVRFSAAQNPNPASSFVLIGDAFRAAAFPLDRYYFNVAPMDDRQLLRLTVGKMPLPIWRGDRGGFRAEMVWDNDISPVGLSAYVRFFEENGIKVDNTLSYFVVHDFFDNRFQGLTGETAIFADQIRLATTYVTAAFAFYDYENLNAGLRSPGFGEGTLELTSATNAFLLRDGFQRTNNQIEYGPRATGFVTEAFRTINPAIEGHIPIEALAHLGKTEAFINGEMSYNLNVDNDAFGVGGTIGFLTGDFENGAIHPVQFWFTYRYVEADATLATFADSDLGAGTAYNGLEVAGTYDIVKGLSVVCSYYNYRGFPRMGLQQHRFDADVIWTF